MSPSQLECRCNNQPLELKALLLAFRSKRRFQLNTICSKIQEVADCHLAMWKQHTLFVVWYKQTIFINGKNITWIESSIEIFWVLNWLLTGTFMESWKLIECEISLDSAPLQLQNCKAKIFKTQVCISSPGKPLQVQILLWQAPSWAVLCDKMCAIHTATVSTTKCL